MTERFGAWQVGDDEHRAAVEFKLFFPDRARDTSQYEATRFVDRGDAREEVQDFGNPRIESVAVAGTFQSHLGQQNWAFTAAPQLQLTPHPKGWLWSFRTAVELPADFYERFIVVLNFSNTAHRVDIPFSENGVWRDLLNERDDNVVDFRLRDQEITSNWGFPKLSAHCASRYKTQKPGLM
jgi:hypothetical protein